MKKRLILSLLLWATPMMFTSNLVYTASHESAVVDDFDFDELENMLDQANIPEQELVKPPSPWVVFFRRIFSPLGVAIIKVCDAIRMSWSNMMGTSA